MTTTNKTAVEEIEDKAFTAYNRAGQSIVRAVRLNDVKQALTQAQQQGEQMGVERERERIEKLVKRLPRNGCISASSVYHQEIAGAHNAGYKQNRDRILKALQPTEPLVGKE